MSVTEIDPTEFDVIVVGTGFAESVIAAATSYSGLRVLQLDANEYYGVAYANLQLHQFVNALEHLQVPSLSHSVKQETDSCMEIGRSEEANECFYRNVELYHDGSQDASSSREYSIDLSPKLVLCTGKSIDLLVASKVYNYLEFKLLQACFLWTPDGLLPVPASRADVFKSTVLGLADKRVLMRFLKKCMEQQDNIQVPQQSLADLLQDEGIRNPLLQNYILYALALAQSSQHRSDDPPPPATNSPATASAATPSNSASSRPHAPPATGSASADSTSMASDAGESTAAPSAAEGPADWSYAAERESGQLSAAAGLQRLQQYIESIGRYGPASTPFLTPLYGSGELPQAFCRLAAVKGAVFALRTGISSFMIDPASNKCTGVKTSGGQVLTAEHVIGDFDNMRPLISYSGAACHSYAISRAVCLLDKPLQQVDGSADLLCVIVPPLSLGQQQQHAVHVLQVGPSTCCSPRDRHLLYCSTISSGRTPREELLPVLQALVQLPDPSLASSPEATVSQGRPADAQQARAEPQSQETGSGAGSVHQESKETSMGQEAKETSVHQETRETSTDVDQRPRALSVAFFTSNMRWCEDAGLPVNVAVCPRPDETLHAETACATAQRIMRRLWPHMKMFSSVEDGAVDGGEDSDDDMFGALQEALVKLEGAAAQPPGGDQEGSSQRDEGLPAAPGAVVQDGST